MKNHISILSGVLTRGCRRNRQSGFTLIELLATLTIMAIIAAALFPFIGNYTGMARKNTSVRSIQMIQDAIDRYMALEGDFQNKFGLSGLNTNASNALNETQLSNVFVAITTPGAKQTLKPPLNFNHQNFSVLVKTGTNSEDDKYYPELIVTAFMSPDGYAYAHNGAAISNFVSTNNYYNHTN